MESIFIKHSIRRDILYLLSQKSDINVFNIPEIKAAGNDRKRKRNGETSLKLWRYRSVLYLEGGVERLINEEIKKFSSIEYNTDNKFCLIQNDEQRKGQYEQHGWIRQREAEYSIYKSNSNQCNSHWLTPYTSLPNSSVSFSILSTSGIRRIPAISTRVHSVSLSMQTSAIGFRCLKWTPVFGLTPRFRLHQIFMC